MAVRTDEMWRYPRTVKLAHTGPCENSQNAAEVWSTLVTVRDSGRHGQNGNGYEGWYFDLECECTIQSCFADTPIEVEVIWHEDVLNWGK